MPESKPKPRPKKYLCSRCKGLRVVSGVVTEEQRARGIVSRTVALSGVQQFHQE